MVLKLKKYTNKNSTDEVLNNNKTKTKKNIIYIGGGNTIANKAVNKIYGKAIEAKKINYKTFDIKTGSEYRQLKRDVRATRISAFFARKFGKLNDTEYKMQVLLLMGNLHFAKLKLYYAKLNKIALLLIKDDNSIIKTIHSKINQIFFLQQQIDKGYLQDTGKRSKIKSDKKN